MDAIELGADYLGFNFYRESPRFIDPVVARGIIEEIPSNIQKVGVFVNETMDQVIDMAIDLDLDMIQFHGDETAEDCNKMVRPWVKAFRLKDENVLKQMADYESAFVMVDAFVEKAFGGTGVVANWDWAREAKKYGKLFLSGGLKTDNVALALEAVKPYAVDVASGVEDAPGKKDFHKMEEFIAIVKSYRLKKHLD